MRIACLIRRDAEYYLGGKLTRSPSLGEKPDASTVIKKWNSTFKLDWTTYRDRLVDIAARNREAAKFDLIVNVKDLDIIKSLPGETRVVVIDDDDFIHPNLTSELRALELDCEAVRWDAYRRSAGGHCSRWTGDLMLSCCYAVRADSDWSQTFWQMSTIPWMKGRYIHRIDKAMAAYNHTPGSLSFLRKQPFAAVVKAVHDSAYCLEKYPPSFAKELNLVRNLLREVWDTRRTK